MDTENSQTCKRAYGVIWVVEETHGILDDHFIFKANEFCDFFGDPWAYDVEIYFFEIYLRDEIGIKFRAPA
jgi:hypothetical protein